MAVIFPIFKSVFQKIKEANLTEILLIAVLVTIPIVGHATNSIAIILFFLSACYKFITNKKQFYFNKISLLLISLYILFLCSLLWTNNLGNTRAGLEQFLSYLVLPIAFIFNNDKQFNKEKVINIFSLSLVIYALLCLIVGVVNASKYSDISFLFYHKLSGSLGNLNAIYLSVFISLGISFFVTKKNKSKLEFLCLIFLSLFLVLLSSKMVIAITFITSILYFLRKRKFKKLNLKSAVLSIVILLVIIPAGSNLFSRIKVEFEKTEMNEVLNTKDFGHSYIWTGFGLRVFQAKAFIEILKEKKNIVLGSGLNNSQDNLNEKYKEYNFYPGFLNYNYHNQYMQIFAELGIVGLCLLLLILLLILKEAIINKDYFLLSFIILILVVSFTESFLWRQRGMVFFITVSLLLTKREKYIN